MSQPDPDTPDPQDPFGPPAIPTLVHCLHCNQEYDSALIEWVVTPDPNGTPWGHWACPIPGCDGAGFCFDIWPVDPEWRDERGEKVWCDDDEGDDVDAFGKADEFIDEFITEIDAYDDSNGDDSDEPRWSPPTSPN